MLSAQRPITGRFVLFVILGFFAVTIGMNALFITLATRTFPGLETDEPYVRGLNYNDTLAERALQAETGWRARLELARGSDSELQVSASVVDAAGQAVTSLLVTAALRHPADANRDVAPFALAEVAPGRYGGAAAAVTDGEWVLVLDARKEDAAPFSSSNRICVAAEASLGLCQP